MVSFRALVFSLGILGIGNIALAASGFNGASLNIDSMSHEQLKAEYLKTLVELNGSHPQDDCDQPTPRCAARTECGTCSHVTHVQTCRVYDCKGNQVDLFGQNCTP